MELEDPKDLRARFRKFLILTNERKKMSKTTLRKRIALVAVTALTSGVLSVVASPAASANHPNSGTDNYASTNGTVNASLFVATAENLTGAAVAIPTTQSGTLGASNALRSLGLLSKDTSSGTAQSATVLAGGVLSFYAQATTSVAFTATGGSFSSTRGGTGGITIQYSADLKTALIPSVASSATAVGTLWTAPSTPGSYYVNMLTGFVANTSGTPGAIVPNLSSTAVPSTLGGRILVTVVAASAGGTLSPVYSACNTATTTTAASAGTYPTGVDSTSAVADGGDWYIDYNLADAYNLALSTGNISVSATNGALVNIGTTGGTAPVAGTGSTDIDSSTGASDTVRISQPTSGAPLTTTVTISYNGTVFCTKTVTIAGKAAKLTVANVGTQDLSTSAGSVQWMYQEIGLGSAGLFTVLATDSAGNIVATPSTYGTFSADAATLTTVVQGMTFPTLASSTSSSSTSRFTLGSFTCGAIAGNANVKVKFTIASTGDVLVSDAFNARCADNPYTYTVSLDKASYTQGELAKVTVAFKDSKGNAANSVTAVGANTWSLPMMTGVSFTLANGASSTAVTKADGTVTYTMTVGTSSGLTAGTYTGIVEFSVPAAGVAGTPTYSVKTGGDTTTNAAVLKSIVALIASINKQIQALQKLILKR